MALRSTLGALLIMVGAAADSEAAGTTLQPGLLLDTDAGAVFLMQPGGGIERVDVDTGETSWRSEVADRPLALTGGDLVAQAESASIGVIEMRRLDAQNGAPRGSYALGLKDDVRPVIDDGMGTRFELKTLADGDFAWRFEQRVVQGAATATPPPPVRHAGRIAFEGSSLKSGAPLAYDDGKVWRPRDTRPTEAFAKLEGRSFTSVDGRHVLLSKLPGDDFSRPYRWQIYDENQSLIGELESPMSYAPFAVVNNQVLFITQPNGTRQGDGTMQTEGLTLRSVSLSSGTESWRREIRDTRYRGPYPQ